MVKFKNYYNNKFRGQLKTYYYHVYKPAGQWSGQNSNFITTNEN